MISGKLQSRCIPAALKLCCLFTLALFSAVAQELNHSAKPDFRTGTIVNNSTTEDKVIGRHTVTEWRHLIDSTWGNGTPTSEKLQIFDSFWNNIDQTYAGFHGIVDNWLQMRNYRDTIALGVSDGRFSGILTHMVQSLHDGHVIMTNKAIAATPLRHDVPLVVSASIELPSWNWGSSSHFGAGLTPLPDSTLLVYVAVDNHPLGLVPGDIVLGYDGKPWKDLYNQLFDVQFPMSFYIVMECSDRAATHQWLGNAGMNWHLFDTIDVVKHSTGDTVHLPTSRMTGALPGIHATEQLSVPGVPFPDVANGRRVSWGYVDGTKIGYIYVLGWYGSQTIDSDFLNAVNSFMPDSSSDGLIIDMRINEGADRPRWVPGFRRLFNFDVDAINFLTRANTTDHLAMQSSSQWNDWIRLTGCDTSWYDRPIAVLCGPWTVSGGDMTVHILRRHFKVRTFGKPTSGAFGIFYMNDVAGIPSEWFTAVTRMVGYTPPYWENILNRASIPVNEEVWLTPDNVAKGKDDVVLRAIAWIDSVNDATAVRSLALAPNVYILGQNYPNPFNPTTRIEFSIAKLSIVNLKIYNLLGQEIATLVNEIKRAGSYSVNWDASSLPSGVYFYRLKARQTTGARPNAASGQGQAGSFTDTKKLILLR